ncbi:MAG: DMT family transporter [Clostridia bacterium]|nr:DMT family transporter [Clostridia bacterium]
MYWLLALTTVCAAGKAIICKRLGSDDKGSRSMFAWNSGIYLVASVVAFLYLYPDFGALFRVSPFTLILSAIFAACLLFTQITEIKAMSLGSASMTILIYSAGFLLPIGYGSLFAGESISVLRWVGIAVMVAAMVCIIRPRKDGSVSPAWVCMSLLSLLGSGMVAVTQKHHQNTVYAGELACFVTLGLLFAALFSFIVAVIQRPKGEKPPRVTIRDAGFVAVSGLCIGVLNLLNLFLAGKIDAAVQFPVYNIGCMILTALFGAFVLKETHTKSQYAGFALGCLSIVLIGL